MRQFDLPLWQGDTEREIKEFDFAPAAVYAFKGLFIYEIDLRLRHLSGESMVLEPLLFQVIPRRE